MLAAGAKRGKSGVLPHRETGWTAKVIGEYGDAIAVGLDVRGTTVATHGWTKDAGDLLT